MRITTLALLALGPFLAACRGGGGDDDVQPDTAPVDMASPEFKISEIQSDSMAPGTVVKLKGVVVTAIDKFGGVVGDIFIQYPAGGPFSGLKVFRPPVDVVATLTVGDLITI